MTRFTLLRPIVLITLAASFLGVASSKASTNAGTLKLDGKLEVSEGGLNGATVTVLQDGIETAQLSKGLRHFVLELELGHDYRISFAKPGCVTKVLALDAHTPDALGSARFNFLFQVTLKARKGDYVYDGPIAVIHFDADQNAFGFDRTHISPRLVKSETLTSPASSHQRREVRPFVDPTGDLAAWVEKERTAE